MAIKIERVLSAPRSGGLGTLKVDWPMARAMVSRIANEELERVQRDYGFPTEKSEYVIRQRGRVLREVTPRNTRIGPMIRYTAVGEGGFREASIELVKRATSRRVTPWAPKTGSAMRSRDRFRQRHYLDSFVLLRDNAVVVGQGPNFTRRAVGWLEKNGNAVQAAGDVLELVNIQPYARLLVGSKGKKSTSIRFPRSGMHKALRAAQSARWGRPLDADRYITFRQLPAGTGERSRMVSVMQGRKRVRKNASYPVLRWGPAT